MNPSILLQSLWSIAGADPQALEAMRFDTAGLSQVSPLRYSSYVLNTALGGGMSSRLFQEVR